MSADLADDDLADILRNDDPIDDLTNVVVLRQQVQWPPEQRSNRRVPLAIRIDARELIELLSLAEMGARDLCDIEAAEDMERRKQSLRRALAQFEGWPE